MRGFIEVYSLFQFKRTVRKQRTYEAAQRDVILENDDLARFSCRIETTRRVRNDGDFDSE